MANKEIERWDQWEKEKAAILEELGPLPKAEVELTYGDRMRAIGEALSLKRARLREGEKPTIVEWDGFMENLYMLATAWSITVYKGRGDLERQLGVSLHFQGLVTDLNKEGE